MAGTSDERHGMTMPCEVLQEQVWQGEGLKFVLTKKLAEHYQHASKVSADY